MRFPRFRRCAQPVRRAILPGRHFVHHLRPRSGLPLSLGGQPEGDRLGRLGDDDGFPGRACDRPDLCVEERGVGLGMSQPTILTPGAMPVAPGTSPDAGFFDDLNAEVGDKGFLVTSTEELFPWARSEEHTSELKSLMRLS